MSHRELIKALKLYPAILKDLVVAIPPEKLHHRIGPGFWTVYEHLEHLVQTQEVLQRRLETIRDQERPQIVPFNPDEHHWDVSASAGGSQPGSAEDLVADYGRWRERQLQVIEKASERLWRRSAQHPEYERYGFEILVRHILLHDGFHLSRMEDLAFMKEELLKPL
jgi:uncharacterized damage-inducible protein DinB